MFEKLKDAYVKARYSKHYRITLAFLANFADERWPFDNFWQAIASSNDRTRWQNANAARNAIRRSVRVEQSDSNSKENG